MRPMARKLLDTDPYSAPFGNVAGHLNPAKINVAVIGNSHLAAFKTGWPQIEAEFPDFELTFFGATRSLLRSLAQQRGALRTNDQKLRGYLTWTSGGLDHIPLDYSAYIVVGCELSFPHMAHILAKHRLPECYDPATDHQLISVAALEAAMRSIYDRSSALWLVQQLRAATIASTVIAPCPFVTTNHKEKNDYWVETGTIKRIFSYYRGLLADLGRYGVVADQPASTLEGHIFTKPQYATGSAKIKPGFEGTRRVDDDHHMNASFGAIALREILASDPIQTASHELR